MVSGQKPLTVTWFKGEPDKEQQQKSSARMKISYSQQMGEAKLLVMEASAQDDGPYRVEVSNSVGKISKNFNVSVVCESNISLLLSTSVIVFYLFIHSLRDGDSLIKHPVPECGWCRQGCMGSKNFFVSGTLLQYSQMVTSQGNLSNRWKRQLKVGCPPFDFGKQLSNPWLIIEKWAESKNGVHASNNPFEVCLWFIFKGWEPESCSWPA